MRQTLAMALFGRGRRAGASANSMDQATNRPAPHQVLGRQFSNRAYWEDAAKPKSGYYGGSGGSSNVGRAVATGMAMHHTINGT